MFVEIRRGDIVDVDFGKTIGSVQGGRRPAIVMSNDANNKHAPIASVIPLTTSQNKKPLPTHAMIISQSACGIKYDSTVLGEQPTTIDKTQIKGFIGRLNNEQLAKVEIAIAIQFGLNLRYA